MKKKVRYVCVSVDRGPDIPVGDEPRARATDVRWRERVMAVAECGIRENLAKYYGQKSALCVLKTQIRTLFFPRIISGRIGDVAPPRRE